MSTSHENRVMSRDPDDRMIRAGLDALVTSGDVKTCWNAMFDASLAPAAPSPEPVATVISEWDDTSLVRNENRKTIPAGTKLYTSPPAPVAVSAVGPVAWVLHDALVSALAEAPGWKNEVRTALRTVAETTPSSDDNKAVRVRALEWDTVQSTANQLRGNSTVGTYIVDQIADGWRVQLHCGVGHPQTIGMFGALKLAKSASQSDCDRRVRACLETGEASRRDAWVAAARSMLEIFDGPAPRCTYDQTERADKDSVINAGCYAAEAYEFGTVDRDHATFSLIHAFLISLIDIADPRLDYLRAGSPPPPAAEEG